MSAGSLALNGLTRIFGSTRAVDDVSLEVQAGELLALIGASGSGKTTTLRMVAGHDTPDAGTITLDGNDITRLPPQRRDFGMVFQHYALFPHMSVEENVAFGLEARRIGRGVRIERAQAVLASVGLDGAGKRQVQSLSGGEQQRVAPKMRVSPESARLPALISSRRGCGCSSPSSPSTRRDARRGSRDPSASA